MEPLRTWMLALIDDMLRPGTKGPPNEAGYAVRSACTHSPFTFTAGDKAVRQRVLQRIRLWLSLFGCCLPADTVRALLLLFGPMRFKYGMRVRDRLQLPVFDFPLH